jgi:hypothetical protein
MKNTNTLSVNPSRLAHHNSSLDFDSLDWPHVNRGLTSQCRILKGLNLASSESDSATLKLQPEQRREAKRTLKAKNTIKICIQSTISYACVVRPVKSEQQSGRSEYDLYDGILHFRMFIKQVKMEEVHMSLSVRAIRNENYPRTAEPN